MTEVQNEKTQNDSLRDQFDDSLFTKMSWEGRQTDGLLQWFVQFVNSTPCSIPVTLTVGGNLISGELISAESYFEQLAANFSGAMPEENRETAKQLILSLQPVNNSESEERPAPQFIHMQEARVFADAGKPIVSSGVLWRGKISIIDGFSLGSLSVTK